MWIITFAALGGFLAVLMGASADHLLKGNLSLDAYSQIQTAIDYQFVHALILVLVGILQYLAILRQRWLTFSAWAFIVGLLAFSGGLYAHAIFALPYIVYIVPFGGLSLMIGWLLLLFSSLPTRS